MNQAPPDMYYSAHMSAGQAPAPQTVTSGGLSHYPHHQQPPSLQPVSGQYSAPPNSYGQYGYALRVVYAHHQQPPSLQPVSGQYSAPPNSYGQYGYANGITSPQQAGQVQGSLGSGPVLSLPSLTAAQPPMHGQQYPQQQQAPFDSTGQVAPPGMKPRVTATLWEDEGSLCFQVEAKGICVARREDNHMINGTKLLNVAGMTRGRRDGILKSEKMRHVVKIGPMHLKGVWIPFERALDFANKEKITELLYPLFVHNIGALLYHPSNQTRSHSVMAAAERRKQEQNQMRNSQAPPNLPSMQSHHHHSMHNSGGGSLPGPQHSQHPGIGGRPDIQRSHTFPTPPTSASSVMGNMGTSDGSFQWGGQNLNGVQGSNPLAIDTGLSNARSMPTTPATTPPGTSIQNMQQYQQTPQSYDNSRQQMYSAPPLQQSAYPQSNGAQTNMGRYNQTGAYIKNEMGPPSGRAPGSISDGGEHHDTKIPNGIIHHSQGNEQVSHSQPEEEAEHDGGDYAHDNTAAYDANRGSYNYAPGPPVGSITNEHAHISPELTGSPNHNGGSGHVTPRTATTSQAYYSQHQANEAPPMEAQLMKCQPLTNGATPSGKRSREDDDDQRPSSRDAGGETDGLKRRRTIREDSAPNLNYDAPLNRARATISQRRR
ncbi:hypothetical protein V495_02382 [Pseudogymnoascus sp. VKM F-4514 (FW-929)]|nr:hypothetical protein V495_02382 [Pseudogymnoascus sp. VKM F-4514 (FW-929)]